MANTKKKTTNTKAKTSKKKVAEVVDIPAEVTVETPVAEESLPEVDCPAEPVMTDSIVEVTDTEVSPTVDVDPEPTADNITPIEVGIETPAEEDGSTAVSCHAAINQSINERLANIKQRVMERSAVAVAENPTDVEPTQVVAERMRESIKNRIENVANMKNDHTSNSDRLDITAPDERMMRIRELLNKPVTGMY